MSGQNGEIEFFELSSADAPIPVDAASEVLDLGRSPRTRIRRPAIIWNRVAALNDQLRAVPVNLRVLAVAAVLLVALGAFALGRGTSPGHPANPGSAVAAEPASSASAGPSGFAGPGRRPTDGIRDDGGYGGYRVADPTPSPSATPTVAGCQGEADVRFVLGPAAALSTALAAHIPAAMIDSGETIVRGTGIPCLAQLSAHITSAGSVESLVFTVASPAPGAVAASNAVISDQPSGAGSEVSFQTTAGWLVEVSTDSPASSPLTSIRLGELVTDPAIVARLTGAELPR